MQSDNPSTQLDPIRDCRRVFCCHISQPIHDLLQPLSICTTTNILAARSSIVSLQNLPHGGNPKIPMKFVALNQLKNIFGLGKCEAEGILLDVTTKVYRKRLGQIVSSGELEMTYSKAAFLQNLCDELRFDPQKASKLHEEIYRQKLQQCVADKELSDENVTTLLKLRVMLYVSQQTVEATHAVICGNLFEKIVIDAIRSRVDGYDIEAKKSVRKAAHGLRLTEETAMSIASKAVRKVFIIYVKRARSAKNNTESAKELKKLIAFNTLVVTQLVKDIKGEFPDVETEEEPVKEETA